ncbi:MAG: hypothetical protein V1810_00795 [Candidatus Beckwithbacteria bacterium]
MVDISTELKFDTLYKDGSFFPLISVILRNIYVIAAVILFLMIFVGGLGMIINAGNAEKQKQSSKTLGSAVIGFLILFLSYWLLKLIQLFTGVQLIYFL